MLLNRAARRPVRTGIALFLLVVALIYLATPRKHVLQADLFEQVLHALDQSLNPQDVTTLCHSHGFRPYDNVATPRKIYDLFLFSYELE